MKILSDLSFKMHDLAYFQGIKNHVIGKNSKVQQIKDHFLFFDRKGLYS
jgi:hypothetical protein